ncbi:MAG TPA: amidohydrolase family protein [Terriglobales bacterium]|nr:amidohydrolase family protein [Terriglobales bacterium]
MTVLIVGDRIADIGSSAIVAVPKNARVLDGKGKFLIPGLWDMHGHLSDATQTAFPLLILNGVTGVRDMGGKLTEIDTWRSEIKAGTRIGPHIVRAGPFVDGPKQGVPNRLTAITPEEARSAVLQLKHEGVDFIKVHNGLPRDAFFALMDEAHKQHISVAIHLPKGIGAAEASDAGAASLEHVETLVEGQLWRPGATAKDIDQALAELEGTQGTALFSTFVKNGTWFVPTLVAYERGFVLWSNQPDALLPRLQVLRKGLEIVRKMHKAGVRMMAGTDFSDWALVPGIDLHNELALLVEAGFSPMEALQAATRNPAEFLGNGDSFGTIEKGKIADLVMLDADPLEDISHTRKINTVVLGGKPFVIPTLQSEVLRQAASKHGQRPQ